MEFPEPFELAAGPYLLRPWRDDDVDATWAALSEPATARWNGTGSESRAAAAEMIARRRDWSAGTHASWAVVEPATDALLGSVSLFSIDREQGDAEIGYWTVPGARGRGIAPVVVDAVCRWAFGALGVERIQLFHAVTNEASARVAEKAGFVREGRLRRSHRYGDGVKHDELLWSRLADDPAPEVTRPGTDGGPGRAG